MRKIFLCLFWLGALQICQAQDTLTFKQCLDIALKNNLALKNAELNERLANYNLASSVSAVLPNANASGRERFSYGRDINPNTNQFTNTKFKSAQGFFTVDMNLFSGFANISHYKIAKKEVEISKAAMQSAINDYTIEIASKFTTILYLEEIVKANAEQLEATQKQLDATQSKFNEGYIPESDVFKIKSQKATQELSLADNQNLLELNYVDLKQLMNLPLDRQIILVKPDEKLISPESLDNEYAIVDQAVSNHPSLKVAKLAEKQSKFGVGLARSYFFPTLNLVYRLGTEYSDVDDLPFDYQIKDKYNYSYTLNFTIPIFQQFRNIYRLKTNKVLYKQAQVNTQIEKNRLSKVVMQAIIDTKSAIKRYDSSLSQYEFSKKSYEADSLKFDLGKISVNELTITRNSFIVAQADVIRSKYELQFNNALIRFYLGEAFDF